MTEEQELSKLYEQRSTQLIKYNNMTSLSELCFSDQKLQNDSQ